MPVTRTPRAEELDALWRAIAAETGVSRHFIRGRSKRPMIAQARRVAVLVLRERWALGWKATARLVGRSHSSLVELMQRTRGDWPAVLFFARRVSDSLDAQILTASPTAPGERPAPGDSAREAALTAPQTGVVAISIGG